MAASLNTEVLKNLNVKDPQIDVYLFVKSARCLYILRQQVRLQKKTQKLSALAHIKQKV